DAGVDGEEPARLAAGRTGIRRCGPLVGADVEVAAARARVAVDVVGIIGAKGDAGIDLGRAGAQMQVETRGRPGRRDEVGVDGGEVRLVREGRAAVTELQDGLTGIRRRRLGESVAHQAGRLGKAELNRGGALEAGVAV